MTGFLATLLAGCKSIFDLLSGPIVGKVVDHYHDQLKSTKCSFDDAWIEHNVSAEGTIGIHIKSHLRLALPDRARCEVACHFYYQRSDSALACFNKRYRSSAGTLVVSKEFVVHGNAPSSEPSLFLPIGELGLLSGPERLRAILTLKDVNRQKTLCRSKPISFFANVPTKRSWPDPSGIITKAWSEPVPNAENIESFNIYVDFRVENIRTHDCDVLIHFSDTCNIPIKTTNPKFSTSEGTVVVSARLTIPASLHYHEALLLCIPFSELNIQPYLNTVEYRAVLREPISGTDFFVSDKFKLGRLAWNGQVV